MRGSLSVPRQSRQGGGAFAPGVGFQGEPAVGLDGELDAGGVDKVDLAGLGQSLELVPELLVVVQDQVVPARADCEGLSDIGSVGFLGLRPWGGFCSSDLPGNLVIESEV